MKLGKVNWGKMVTVLANLKCPNCFSEKVKLSKDDKVNTKWKIVPKDTSFMHI